MQSSQAKTWKIHVVEMLDYSLGRVEEEEEEEDGAEEQGSKGARGLVCGTSQAARHPVPQCVNDRDVHSPRHMPRL